MDKLDNTVHKTTSFSVLMNRIPGEPFGPERGIRQENPISSNIFLLAYIHFVTNVLKLGICINVSKNGPIIHF